ncbi:MAG TPA: glycoside hydrolase family 9 protein [Oleiagrimonas sp.]|nr:glycoside hydrolase family 9 protein [Oleiagrimonas sp.]
MLYADSYSPIFFDQKNAALQIILHGRRIATNGSMRFTPTPEQWSRIPHLKAHHADRAGDRLDAELSYPDYHIDYHVSVAPEPGGFRISLDLDKPLPAALVGRVGYNLEFLPSLYAGKAYRIGDDTYGRLPQYPEGRMTAMPPPAGAPSRPAYIERWRKARHYMVPRPLVEGERVTLAPASRLYRVTIRSDGQPVKLYDGRNQASNGWFVVRSTIPAGKTTDALVWHVQLASVPGWTRPPVITHSQVGYATRFPKVAVIELDPAFDAPPKASLLRLSDEGVFKKVYQARVSKPRHWLRYDYAKFDFSSVTRPGLYTIAYAGQQTRPFRIADDVYANTWQTSLDGFMAVQMDHVAVHDAYRVWHGVAHMDDARQAPPNIHSFDGYWMGAETWSPFEPGEHVPGLDVGGWFDAGDFDSDALDQLQTIRNLAVTYATFRPAWDQLTVDEKARQVVMHQPDGTPDMIQQIEHGVLQTLAQIHAFGHPIMGVHASTLSQYTFIGDAASQTDGHIHDPNLGQHEVVGNRSGMPDDRWAWTNHNVSMDYSAIASLAAASSALKGWNDDLARDCLGTAINLWNHEQAHPGPDVPARFDSDSPPYEWVATLQLLIATDGAKPYRKRVQQLFPEALEHMMQRGWMAVRGLSHLDPAYTDRFKKALVTWLPEMRRQMAKTPFGVPPATGGWGNSAQVARFGIAMYFLHRAFPDLVGPEATLRVANYLLGTHPVNSVSYIAGVGAVSKPQTYSNNRGDHSHIPGGMIPGYIIIKPDFPECITDFGMLWFEDETTIGAATSWILEANAAAAIVRAEGNGVARVEGSPRIP